MSPVTGIAIYVVIWWITLFAILPIGVKTQADEEDITLGTTESAPHRHRMGFKLILTSLVAAAIFALYYFLVVVFELSVDSIPRIVPDFSGRG
ncbi:DUF1467 family protein [Hoeflea sp. WL0058]|uniref:DUF1467 family protein n=1 Tax=Flavimaribacter sediminis TaxID=2865987 RepID=A0AAE2ZHZ2_9HYPH|nr:DUF1467 family protein [Flavimaribacter sediminis]MBW8636581.1 DUF1467 family protein [Flavimaribacter sediminis]